MFSSQSRFLYGEFVLEYGPTNRPFPFQPLSTCCATDMRPFGYGAKKQRQCHYCNRYVCPSRLNRCSSSQCFRQKRRGLWCVCELCLKHGRHYITDTRDVEVGGCRDRRNQQKQARNIQKIWRGYLVRKQMRVKSIAATKIQKRFRAYLVRCYLSIRVKSTAATTIEAYWRWRGQDLVVMRGVCDVCGNSGWVGGECCGVKACVSCDARFWGRCVVHQRDELNAEMWCNGCGKRGNNMTILRCIECEDWFCDDCLWNKNPIRPECFFCHFNTPSGHFAATKIQAAWRGYVVRKFYEM
jgi:hypothetical protein